MTSESRPAPDWAGGVGLGVQAWVGETPASSAPPEAPRRRRRSRSRAINPSADQTSLGPDADPEAVARTILLNALTGQARSRQELADKLSDRGVPDDIAVALLDRFTEVGLIDDAAFAQQWVESRHRSRGLAPRALAQELRRKGVEDEIAHAALEQIDDADQRTAARALVDKKVRSLRNVDQLTATRRLAGLLARKGYAAGLAYSVVREALGELEDEPEGA